MGWWVLLCLLIGNSLYSQDTIVLDRVHLTMEELVREASLQTNRKIHLLISDRGGSKNFYDCTTTLPVVLQAVKGYFKSRRGLAVVVKESRNELYLTADVNYTVEVPVTPL